MSHPNIGEESSRLKMSYFIVVGKSVMVTYKLNNNGVYEVIPNDAPCFYNTDFTTKEDFGNYMNSGDTSKYVKMNDPVSEVYVFIAG